MQERLNNFLNGPYFVPIIIILIAVIAFCLGRISGLQEKREPVRVLDNSNNSPSTSVNNPPNPPYIKGGTEANNVSVGEVKGVSTDSSGSVVASKNGTKYHYPWCAGAKQISQKNIITFNSIDEAKKAGYSPASNCKGLK
ncbi:MAG: hypothetical protein AAB837_00140 [Patescibacteria group bacterium]